MTPKPRIAHVSSVHSASDIRIFHKECATLSASEYYVYLIAKHNREDEIQGVKIIPIRGKINRLGRLITTGREIYRLVTSGKVDTFHLHDPELLPFGQILRLMGKTVIFDMHEDLPLALPTRDWVPKILTGVMGVALKYLERLLLTGMPVVFAEISYGKRRKWINKSTTVLNMPLTDRIMEIAEEKHKQFSICYLGSVSKERGSFTSIEAIRILHGRGFRVRFDIVGNIDRSHRDELLSVIRRYHLTDDVFVHGQIEVTEGWKAASRCHVGLATLHPEPNYVDSYPTKIFEYMALGIPVVASNFPLYASIVNRRSCGICVNPVNPKEIANAVQQLIENGTLASTLGHNGRRAVQEEYKWENEARKLLIFYDDILGWFAGARRKT